MTKALLSLLLFALVVSSTPLIARPVSGPALSNADKAAIIQLAVELIRERETRLKSQGHPSTLSEFMIVSKENMSPDLLPKLPGFRLSLMGEKEIQKSWKRSRTFKYLRVGEFSGGSEVVGLSVAISESRGGLPYHFSVYKYQFTKSGEKWQGTIHTVIC